MSPIWTWPRRLLARLWAALGRRLRATKPAQPLGLLGASLPVLALSGSVMILARVAGLVAVIYGAYWYVDRTGYKRGVATEVARQAKVMAEANARIDRLNRELDQAQAALHAERAALAANAVEGVVSNPKCVKSDCSLPPNVIEKLNRIE